MDGTRRRRDDESENMKNEEVAEGRIIGLAGPCLDTNLSSTRETSYHVTTVKSNASSLRGR